MPPSARLNLAAGQITNGVLVGPAATPLDFEGGFAVLPAPEPAAWLLMGLGGAALVFCRRRR